MAHKHRSKHLKSVNKKRRLKVLYRRSVWASFLPLMPYPEIPVFEPLRVTSRRSPDDLVIIYKEKEIAYRELDDCSDRLATALNDLGIGRGSKVAIFMKNLPEYIISFYGILKAGATVTTINPRYTEREVEYHVNDSEAEAMITHESQLPIVKRAKNRIPHLKHIIVEGEGEYSGAHRLKDLMNQYLPEPPRVKLNPKEDLAVILYTAGTTGMPKGVMLTHYNLVTNAVQNAVMGYGGPDSRVLVQLPLYHAFGMVDCAVTQAYTGSSMVLVENPADLRECVELIEKHKVRLWPTIPPVLIGLVGNPGLLFKYDLSSLRGIVTGAAPIAPVVVEKFKELTGGRITVNHGYGLSEACSTTHANPSGRIKIESIGRPAPDTEQKIVDLETGTKELSPGEVGELVIKGPQVMKGYWKRQKETVETLRNGWLFTGDIAQMDEEGYVYIVDRKKEIIKFRGFTIAPFELEALLMEHLAVADCAVIGKPDQESGEIPKAYVKLKTGVKATEGELIQFVKERITSYKRIREVEFTNIIPRSAAGKILRRELKEKERARVRAKDKQREV